MQSDKNSQSNTQIVTQTTNRKLPSPTEFLEQAFGRQVTVKLTNDIEITGNLLSLDGAMNIVLEACEELNPIDNSVTRHPNLFIRGNNGKSFFNFSFLR